MEGVLQNLQHKIQTAEADDEHEKSQQKKDHEYLNKYHEMKEMENRKRKLMQKDMAHTNKATMSERRTWDVDYQDERLNEKIGLTKEQM